MQTQLKIKLESVSPICTMKYLADVIAENQLYLATGSMLRWSRKRSNIRDIIVASADNKYIAASIILNNLVTEYPGDDINIGIFVDYDYRRMGVGTHIMQFIQEKHPTFEAHPWKYETRACKFYNAVGFPGEPKLAERMFDDSY